MNANSNNDAKSTAPELSSSQIRKFMIKNMIKHRPGKKVDTVNEFSCQL